MISDLIGGLMKIKLDIQRDSTEDIRKKLMEIYTKDTFTSEEINSLDKWQSSGNDGINAIVNNYLRGNVDYISENVVDHINNISNACNKIELPFNVVVQRGTNYFPEIEKIKMNKPHNVFIDYKYTEKGFFSTGIDRDFGRPVRWVIDVSKGTKAVYLEGLVSNRISAEFEKELLIQRNTTMTIYKVKTDSEGYFWIYARI